MCSHMLLLTHGNCISPSVGVRVAMPETTFLYRTRRYRVSFRAEHTDEMQSEQEHLTTRKPWREELWTHQQFVDIVTALECLYSRQRVCDNSRVTIKKTYLGKRFSLQVPGQFFFRATLHIESIFCIDAVRKGHVSLEDFKVQWQRMIIVGSSTIGAVFAWGNVWSMPDDLARPIFDFQHAMDRIFLNSCCLHVNSRKAMFARLWDVAVLGLQSDPAEAVHLIQRRCHGENWIMYVDGSSAWKAVLAVETLLLDPPPDVAALRAAWRGLENEFSLRSQVACDADSLFENLIVDHVSVPAARAPRHYVHDPAVPCDIQSSPEAVKVFSCKLCAFHSHNIAAFDAHLSQHFDATEKRSRILAREAAAWPCCISSDHTQACAMEYANAFWARMRLQPLFCACCARGNQHVNLRSYDLRDGCFSLPALHEFFSASRYHELHCSLYPIPLPQHFVGLPKDVLLLAGVAVPLEMDASVPDAWLLHLSVLNKTQWQEAAATSGMPLACHLCEDCAKALRQQPPRLPPRALANGNVALPFPDEFHDLSFAECVFIARGFTVKRMHTLPGRSSPADRQRGFSGNVVSFPQNSASIAAVLPRHPDEAAELLTVFFESETPNAKHSKGPYLVRRARVLASLLWLQKHNPFYADVQIDEQNLLALPENGVPIQFFVAASSSSMGADLGPADAQVGSSQGSSDTNLPLAAAVLDSEGEAIHPVEMWRHALNADVSETSQARAVPYDTIIPHGEDPLSCFDVGYWVLCFPHLFPYGDCVAGGARRVPLYEKTWARHLLTRVDRLPAVFPWSLDIDFLSVLFSVLHRKELLQAVHAKIHTPGFTLASADFQKLLHTDFRAIYAILGDNDGAGLATGIQGIYNWNSIFVVNLFSESHRETDVCVMSIIFQWKPGRFNGRFTTSWIFQKHHHPTDINWYILYIVYTHIMSALGPIV